MSLSRVFLLLTAAHLFAPLAAAQATWVGKTVILKTNKVKLTRAEGVGKKGDVQLRDITFLVLAERDGFLQVNDGHGSVGWFDKADAILPNDAVAYFSARLEKSDKDVAAFNGRASAHQLKGDFYLAVKDYTQALSLQPQAPVFTNRGGIYLENLKELDKAIADFNDAIRLDPKYASAYLIAPRPGQRSAILSSRWQISRRRSSWRRTTSRRITIGAPLIPV
jgi:tetratricopeptide (TPR) repeat protein